MREAVIHGTDALTDGAVPAGAQAPLMRARGVCLQRGQRMVLDRIDLTLGAVGCTAILGPNGAGKSLLLKVLHGLIEPDAGSLTWEGRPARQVTHHQALVFQTPVLLRRSVAANLDFVLRARGTRRTDVRDRRDALLDHVGLLDKAKQPARRLSGGEAQRLALARAFATNPQVLLLDEPTASLDPASVLRIEAIVSQACARGVRVVLVTHDIGQARRLANDVVFLCNGQVKEHTAADPFFSTPAGAEARAFVHGHLVV